LQRIGAIIAAIRIIGITFYFWHYLKFVRG